MNPTDIQRAFGERQNAVGELRTLVEQTEGEEFSGEQQATYDRINASIDTLDERIDTVDVRGRVRPGEGHPEKILERRGGESTVIDHRDQRETVHRVIAPTAVDQSGDVTGAATSRALDSQHAGQRDTRIAETIGQPDLGRHFGGTLYETELRHLVDHEYARAAQDVLWRRSKLGLRHGRAWPPSRPPSQPVSLSPPPSSTPTRR